MSTQNTVTAQATDHRTTDRERDMVNRDTYGETGYGKFLEGQVAHFRRVLSEPNTRYPNGRMSHDVATEQLNAHIEALEDYRIERGLLYADGRFAGYQEASYLTPRPRHLTWERDSDEPTRNRAHAMLDEDARRRAVLGAHP